MKILLAVASFAYLVAISGVSSQTRQVVFENFEDYLVSVVVSPGQNRNSSAEGTDGSTDSGNETPNHSLGRQEEILSYLREIPRNQWSCCMVGMLAGSKGFHCYPGFYAARIRSRNYNRAHNRHLPMHSSSFSRLWGMDIMRTFNRCVTNHGRDFHRCCYAATVEQQELTRWLASRRRIAASRGEQ